MYFGGILSVVARNRLALVQIKSVGTFILHINIYLKHFKKQYISVYDLTFYFIDYRIKIK